LRKVQSFFKQRKRTIPKRLFYRNKKVKFYAISKKKADFHKGCIFNLKLDFLEIKKKPCN